MISSLEDCVVQIYYLLYTVCSRAGNIALVNMNLN